MTQAKPDKILIIGGSGFVSGTLARLALERGHQVWAVTRGQRSLPAGVTGLVADRQDGEVFSRVIAEAGTDWDLVVDCIGFQPSDAEQDLTEFRERAKHLVFVSTDFVYDPARRQFPQAEDPAHYLSTTGDPGSLAYGANKRQCELAFIDRGTGDAGAMAWSVVRPCHIYGPGSLLGCLPLHGRDPELLNRLRAGEPLTLVGGGHFLQQPILAADLARVILDLYGNPQAHGQIFCTTGPDTIESRTFYQIIADILGVELTINELPVSQYLADHPEHAPFLCHRIYDMSKLQSIGVTLPDTPLETGLRMHVKSLL